MEDFNVKYEEDEEEDEEFDSDCIEIKVECDMIIKKEEYNDYPIKNQKPKPTIKRGRKPKQSSSKPLTGVKNVVKNYGKAMCSFAYSEMAKPYLQVIVKRHNITIQEFSEWVQNYKERVDSIESLRWLLLALPSDEESIRACKRVFQNISEIFLRFFCVNWIYSGKLRHKQTHLNFRTKMLRRVRNPELFTYLQNSNKKGSQ